MNNDGFRKYYELEDDGKEVLDSFRQIKLLYDHARFKYHRLQVEDLINDYEQLKSYVKRSKSSTFQFMRNY